MKYHAGLLTHPIRFEAPQFVSDSAFGQAIEHYAPIGNACDWAGATTTSGGEHSQADQRQASNVGVFVVRYRNDITPTMRLIDEWEGIPGTAWNITSARDEDGRRQWLTLDCVRQTAGASP